MKRLLCLLMFFGLPLSAVDVTITIGPQTERFSVSADGVAAIQALRAARVDKNGKCPALKKNGSTHDCSTGAEYVMWKLKQLVNHAKKNHPQGQDATDAAAIATLKAAMEARKVE